MAPREEATLDLDVPVGVDVIAVRVEGIPFGWLTRTRTDMRERVSVPIYRVTDINGHVLGEAGYFGALHLLLGRVIRAED